VRSLSTAAKLAMFSSQTDKVILPLIKVSGPGIATPLRFARNLTDIVSTVEGSSQTYTAFPFNILLPSDKDDGVVKTVELTVDGVDQTIVQAVRPLTVPPTVTLWIVVADSPNVIEVGPLNFTVDSSHYDAMQMGFTLKYEDRLGNRLEGLTFDPVNFPGVH
jgi:hypothetical protein